MAKKKFAICVDYDRCKGCVLCIEHCPKDVFVVAEGRMNAKGVSFVEALKPELCTGCQSCVVVCPDACITITRIDEED